MTSEVEAFPLSWPAGRRRQPQPTRSQFGDISFARARDTLIRELELLGAERVVLSTNIPIKNDGLPYASRMSPSDRGVAVYFILRKKPMVFACDDWDRIEHNVWAITKTINALRGIERWGSGDMLERAFTGFAALPAPESKKHWREVLGMMGSGGNPGAHTLLKRRNELAQRYHPDKPGGSAEKMAEVNRAFEEACIELKGGSV